MDRRVGSADGFAAIVPPWPVPPCVPPSIMLPPKPSALASTSPLTWNLPAALGEQMDSAAGRVAAGHVAAAFIVPARWHRHEAADRRGDQCRRHRPRPKRAARSRRRHRHPSPEGRSRGRSKRRGWPCRRLSAIRSAHEDWPCPMTARRGCAGAKARVAGNADIAAIGGNLDARRGRRRAARQRDVATDREACARSRPSGRRRPSRRAATCSG